MGDERTTDHAIVFLHASNRSTARAWPMAAELPGSRFAVMPGYGTDDVVPFDQDAWEAALVAACPPGAVVVAHSFGGPVAMRAAARRPDRIAGLVLLEPGAYALARGHAAIEAHIARVQPVLDAAADLDAVAFGAAFAAALTGGPADPPVTPDDVRAAERQRMLPGPWSLDTPTAVGVPVLVVTGGWHEEYETIAAAVPDARRVTLHGHGHRPQDHPDAASVVSTFIAGLPR